MRAAPEWMGTGSLAVPPKEKGRTVSGWIPTTDCFPEDGEAVLVSDGYRVNVASRYAERGRFGGPEKRGWGRPYGWGFEFEPTHWQPLPEPPGGEGAQ